MAIMSQFPKLIDQISTAIILLDLNGRFRYLNNSAERFLGITARNLIGKRFSFFIEAETLPVRKWLAKLDSHETKIFDKRKIQFKNNQTIEAELALQKVSLEGENYLLIEWQNSTHAKKHQQEQELLRQQQIQQQLLKNLAHEIKTPLSGIAGAAQLFSPSDSDDNTQVSEIILKEVKRLAELVDRMLLGQQKASRISINIHEVIEDVIGFIELKTPKGLEIKRDYDPSLPEIKIAPEQIYQVILNLTQNSLDALKSISNAKLCFKTRITKEHPLTQFSGQAICISVIDNGIGIAKELQANIFFPMISGKNSSGLGLGIAQSLIRQHQGLIEFEPEVGNTQFHCYLPLTSNEDLQSG